MTFQDAVRTCFSKYVTFSGRARRSEYWWFFLFVVAGSLAASLVDGIVFGFGENAANILEPLFGLAVFLPSLAAGARRLHDRDMSAWWLLLLLLPVVGFLVLLVIYALPGTEGPNRFGPDPLAPGEPPFHHRESTIPRVADDE